MRYYRLMGRNTLPIVWCLGAAALFGASTPASKAVLASMHPVTLAGLLYLGAAIGVLPFSFRGGSWRLARRRRHIVRLMGAVFFGGILGPVLLLLGLSLAPAASVSLWLNLESVATALLAWAFFKEHLGPRTWIAAGLVFVAGVILASPSSFGLGTAALLVALACLSWGIDNNLEATIDGLTPAQVTLAKGTVAGLVNLALGLALEGPIGDPRLIPIALALGALGYGLSIVLYVSGAQKLGAARSQMLFATSPFLGTVIAWTALAESVQVVQIVAALVIAAGLALMLSERHEHSHSHDAVVHTHDHTHDDEHHDHVHESLPLQARHTHEHSHGADRHSHPHMPDLHHRHGHRSS